MFVPHISLALAVTFLSRDAEFMATERGFESHETRQGSIPALVQAALAGANRGELMLLLLLSSSAAYPDY